MPPSLPELVLLIACFVSFTWAVQAFFARPSGGALPGRMRLVAATGLLTALSHGVGLVVVTPPVDTVRSPVAIGLYLGSLGLFWWSIRTARHHRLAVAFAGAEPARVLSTGPYRMVRHPFYTSYTLTWIAGAVALGTWWAGLGVVVMLAQYAVAIREEESRLLASPLAEDYRAYRRRTGLVLPRWWARTGPATPSASEQGVGSEAGSPDRSTGAA